MEAGEEGFKYSGAAQAGDAAWRVVVAPGRSRQAAAWIAAVSLASLGAAVASDAPAAPKAAIAAAVIAGGCEACRRHVLRTAKGSVRRLEVDLGGRVEVRRNAGPAVAGRLRHGSFVAPSLIVLHWMPEGARFARTVFLLPDMAGEQEWRKLRVLLRLTGA